MKLLMDSPKRKCDGCAKSFPEARMTFVLRGSDGKPGWACDDCVQKIDPKFGARQSILFAGDVWEREE